MGGDGDGSMEEYLRAQAMAEYRMVREVAEQKLGRPLTADEEQALYNIPNVLALELYIPPLMGTGTAEEAEAWMAKAVRAHGS